MCPRATASARLRDAGGEGMMETPPPVTLPASELLTLDIPEQRWGARPYSGRADGDGRSAQGGKVVGSAPALSGGYDRKRSLWALRHHPGRRSLPCAGGQSQAWTGAPKAASRWSDLPPSAPSVLRLETPGHWGARRPCNVAP